LLWLTGLSGSGKSTLALRLERQLLEKGRLAAVIDGDVLRTGLTRDLGFSAADRRENVRRAAEAAFLLADAGVVTIAALISPFRADRADIAARARARRIPFAEIYVAAPLAACEQRDPKGLYRRARAGLLPLFTGIDSPYEAPRRPRLTLRTDRESVAASARKLLRVALLLARPAPRPGPRNA